MFDPYRKWLGILPKDQPPNFYRLLSVELFENDLDVIEGAVDRTMGFIRQYQSGEHAAEAAALLNELARARLCLLKPQTKADYDTKLKSEIGNAPAPITEADAAGINWEAAKSTIPPRRPVASKRKKSKSNAFAPTQWAWSGAAGVLLLVVALLFSKLNQKTPVSNSNQNPPPAGEGKKSDVAQNKTDLQTVTSTSATPSIPPQQTNPDVASQTKNEGSEQAKSEIAGLAKQATPEPTKQDAEPIAAVIPAAPIPPVQPAIRFDPTKMTNLVPNGDMEFPGTQFKKAFQTVTPEGKPFALNRWEQNPHSGKACLHIVGSYQWACVKIAKLDIPPGKTIHGSMWRRADRGTGNFLLIGFNNKDKVLNKEIYGDTGQEWEETHRTLKPDELGKTTQLGIELITSKDFDVYFDDIRVWIDPAESTTLEALATSRQVDLTNNSFETRLEPAWTVETFVPRSQQAKIVNNQAKSGKSSLLFKTDKPDDIRCLQKVIVKPHTRYRLSVWVKTAKVKVTQEGGGVGAALCVPDVGVSSSLFGDNDWTELKYEFDTGPREQIELGPRLGFFGSVCTGAAWFDDIQLTEILPSRP